MITKFNMEYLKARFKFRRPKSLLQPDFRSDESDTVDTYLKRS
jgi:hypothetical protein